LKTLFLAADVNYLRCLLVIKMNYVDLLPIIFVAVVFAVLIGNLTIEYLYAKRAKY